jgi:hypothetical protein
VPACIVLAGPKEELEANKTTGAIHELVLALYIDIDQVKLRVPVIDHGTIRD